MAAILDVQGLAVARDPGFAAALPRLRLEAGGIAALFGPSGTGKSTLLRAVLGLSPPDVRRGGSASVCGDDLAAAAPALRRHRLRRDVVYLAQDALAALDPLLPVGRQVAAATGAGPAAVAAQFAALGLANPDALAARLPAQLSGGEAQRALLAIALLRRPALVVADEPSANLDAASRVALAAQFGALAAQGSAVLLASHDEALLQLLGAERLVARDGCFAPGAAAPVVWPAAPPPPPPGPPVLAAAGLAAVVGGRRVLDGVDLTLARGEVVAVVGDSGAGKTTLLRALAGQLAGAVGRVQRPAPRAAVQRVGQDAAGSLTPRRRLGGLLAEAPRAPFDLAAVLPRLGLAPALLRRPSGELSGGEQRRAALLRALAVAPAVLLLDEPTADLDAPTARELVGLLLALVRERGLALLLVTHDHGLAQAVAHRTLTLRGGKLWPVGS